MMLRVPFISVMKWNEVGKLYQAALNGVKFCQVSKLRYVALRCITLR